jgi:hypothetical protein
MQKKLMMNQNKRKVFLSSSTSGLKIAEIIQTQLSIRGYEVEIWRENSKLSQMILDTQIEHTYHHDFAIFILHPEDTTIRNNACFLTARDNVIFEAGLFIGANGKSSCVFVCPSHSGGMQHHYPTDLQGSTFAKYDSEKFTIDPKEAVESVCNQIDNAFLNHMINPPRKNVRIAGNIFQEAYASVGVNKMGALDTWRSFGGIFLGMNPSWKHEIAHTEWFEIHVERYLSEQFKMAQYLIDDEVALGPSGEQEKLGGLTGFVAFLRKFAEETGGDSENNSIWAAANKKMKIYLCPGIRSHVASFVGTSSGQKIACMFLRDSEDTVLITKDPEFILGIEEKINLKINGRRALTPRQLLAQYGT